MKDSKQQEAEALEHADFVKDLMAATLKQLLKDIASGHIVLPEGTRVEDLTFDIQYDDDEKKGTVGSA
jgi:hypothetical protein